MEFAAFTSSLQGPPAPVYLLCGEESYFREKGRELLQARLKGESVRLASSEISWPKILDELYTPSMTGQVKLVVVADDGNFLYNHAPLLEKYVKSPSSASVLAGLVPGKAPVLEHRNLVHIDCRTLKGLDLTRWVTAEFQRRGKTADRQTVQLLVSRTGAELATLDRHIENLTAFVAPRAAVGSEDVKALVSDQASHEVYELSLAAASKKVDRAMEVLHRLLADGESPQTLLWKLAWQYRKLVDAKKLLAAGLPRIEVTARLQITYYAEEFLGFVEAHTLEELLAKHGRILQTDLALKTSGGAEIVWMDKLMCELASPGLVLT